MCRSDETGTQFSCLLLDVHSWVHFLNLEYGYGGGFCSVDMALHLKELPIKIAE